MKHRPLPFPRRSRFGHKVLLVLAAIMVGIDFVPGQNMPGETDPVASGFSLSGSIWYKAGKAVTGSSVSEFRVIEGKPYWKSGNQYHYNSMDSETGSDWGFRGACTTVGASCFFVLQGKVFYRSGSTFYYNDLSSHAIGSNRWENGGACTQSGVVDFRVVGRKVFYRIGTTYFHNSLLAFAPETGTWGDLGSCTGAGASEFQVYGGSLFYRIGSAYYHNSLSTFSSNFGRWGLDGVCTQAGVTNFRVSNRKPYWSISATSYRNSIGLYSPATLAWSEIETVSGMLPPPDAPDPSYDPCAYAYIGPPAAPTNVTLSNATVSENLPPGTPVGTLSTTDPNPGDTFSYLLVNGAGDGDNGAFTINGSVLKTAAAFNFEANGNLNVRIRTSDQGGLFFEKTFVIVVLDQLERPFQILDISGDSMTGFTIQWTSEAGYFYQVQYSDALRTDDWHDVGGEQTAASGESELTYTDVPSVGRSSGFYRVRRSEFP